MPVPDPDSLFDLRQDFRHEGLSSETGDDRHNEEQVDLVEIGLNHFQWSGGVQSKTGHTAPIPDHFKSGCNLVMSLRLGVDGNQVCSRLQKARDVVIRPLDHEVHIEKNIVGGVNGFHHRGAKGDVINKMSVHDVEVQPIGPTCDCPGTFFHDTGKICGQHGGGDNPVGIAPFLHLLGLAGRRFFSRLPQQGRKGRRAILDLRSMCGGLRDLPRKAISRFGWAPPCACLIPVRDEPIIDLTSDAYFMGQALREAHKAYAAEEVPIGAVVVCEGKVIARGWNQVETLSDATAHAEMLALTAAQNMIGDWRLENCTLYVTKEPCPMCAGAIIHCRPERVVFGCPDLKGGAAGGWINLLDANPPLNHRCEATGGVLQDECVDLLQNFFREARAKKAGRIADRASPEGPSLK